MAFEMSCNRLPFGVWDYTMKMEFLLRYLDKALSADFNFTAKER
jgi:hypothetical protein